MRKCPACGYLLFGDGETCKHCGAALPSEAAAELVRRGTCRGVAARAAGTVPPSPAAPPTPASPRRHPRVPSSRRRRPCPPYPDGPVAPIGPEYWSPPTVSGPHGGTGSRARQPPRAAGAHLHRVDGLRLGGVQPRVRQRPVALRHERVRGRVTASRTRRPTTRSTRSSRRRPPSTTGSSRSRRLGDDQPRRRCKPTTTRSSPAAWCCRSRFRAPGWAPSCTRS